MLSKSALLFLVAGPVNASRTEKQCNPERLRRLAKAEGVPAHVRNKERGYDHPCQACNNFKGISPRLFSRPCHECNGTGSPLERKKFKAAKKCDKCSGDGQVRRLFSPHKQISSKKCEECNGTGLSPEAMLELGRTGNLEEPKRAPKPAKAE